MNKSVIVMDTPERCVKCVAFVVCSLEHGILYGEGLKAKDKPNKKVCKLKPLPEYEKTDSMHEYIRGTSVGWNACLDEILGGTDNE